MLTIFNNTKSNGESELIDLSDDHTEHGEMKRTLTGDKLISSKCFHQIFSGLLKQQPKTKTKGGFPAIAGSNLFLTVFFLSFILGVESIGYIELSLRHLVLRKPPSGCCTTAAECDGINNPSRYCPLNFRLFMGLDTTISEGSQSHCAILDRNFTLHVRALPPLDVEDKSFTVLEFPQQRFDFTSNAISQNMSVQLEIWNEHDGKLLLFTRDFARLSPSDPFPRTFKTWQYGTSLVFQLSAHCAPNFVGQGCDVFCQPPSESEKYVCTPEGIKCLPGWSGPKCSRPICEQKCANGGICVAPNLCQCARGWQGEDCAKCVPRAGCQNGFCRDEPGKCFCLPNWTGPECNIIVDKCLERPCKNGGQCTTNGTHGDFFRCDCPEGFTGADCSISIDVCENMPCGEHGQCIPLTNSYTCTCAPGYGGKNCHRRIAAAKPPVDDHQINLLSQFLQLSGPAPQKQNDTSLGTVSQKYSGVPGFGSSSEAQQEQFQQNHIDFLHQFRTLLLLLVLLLVLILVVLCCVVCSQNSRVRHLFSCFNGYGRKPNGLHQYHQQEVNNNNDFVHNQLSMLNSSASASSAAIYSPTCIRIELDPSPFRTSMSSPSLLSSTSSGFPPTPELTPKLLRMGTCNITTPKKNFSALEMTSAKDEDNSLMKPD